MKHLFSIAILATALIGQFAGAANKCDQNKREIGTKIQVTLALNNGTAESRQFEVSGCKSGVFTAYDQTQNSTVMQYAAGQGNVRKIRFVGSAGNADAFRAVVDGRWDMTTGNVTLNTPAQEPCPAGQHHDASMGGMCMPDPEPPKCPPGQHSDPNMGGMCMPDQAPIPDCPPGQHHDSSMGGMCMPDQPTPPDSHGCPSGQHWDSSMNMCMPNTNTNGVMTMFHYNQFVILTSGSGPRGRTAVSAPNMWMLMLDKKTSDRNTLELSWMGTTDLWTVPKNGTPELFQAGEANASGTPFIDAQHPHSSPIMGLTFSDILSFGANGENKLTFFFAPRGEATAGPQAFMHRASAEGNPDAPLGHHLQDVFHITSTVVGVKADYGKLTLEASTFSGAEPSPSQVNLDMHRPDSYAVRANYRVNENVTIGGSYARVKALDREGNSLNKTEDERATAAWIQTSYSLKSGKLSTATIWGQNDNRDTGVQLNSFLEEFLYELGKNNFYGRFEILQRTPEQLEVQVTDGKTGAKWIKSFTLGYERQIQSRGNLQVYAGTAASVYSIPKDFRPTYGASPVAAKVYLRIKFGNGMQMNR